MRTGSGAPGMAAVLMAEIVGHSGVRAAVGSQDWTIGQGVIRTFSAKSSELPADAASHGIAARSGE
ncbi:hypothetical protein GCM10010193_69110 [Kitasatospora atroaurantiaca]